MRYKEVVFLHRDGADDFTMWALDLPEADAAELSTGCTELRGTLRMLMTQLPLPSEDTADQLHLLMKDGTDFVLRSRDVPFSFIEQHQYEGYSVRGDFESVLSETAELFQEMPVLDPTQQKNDKEEMKNMADSDKIQKLLDSPSVTLGYVYKAGSRERYWFDGTPENIASFLMRFPNADQIILTDSLDMLVLNTIGTFIDTCPDQERLSQILAHLVPMQMGASEPNEFFCPNDQEINDHYSQFSRYDMTFS